MLLAASVARTRFKGKYYSLEETFIGKEVFIIATYERINIYFKNKLVETHARLYCGNTSKSTKMHHRKPAERVMDDNSHYIKRAERLGPNVKEVVMRILLQGNGFVDTRKIWAYPVQRKILFTRRDVYWKRSIHHRNL